MQKKNKEKETVIKNKLDTVSHNSNAAVVVVRNKEKQCEQGENNLLSKR